MIVIFVFTYQLSLIGLPDCLLFIIVMNLHKPLCDEHLN